MVTLNRIGNKDNNNMLEIYGLSADTKPTIKIDEYEVVNGSVFVEMDTKKVFIFDSSNDTWREF